MITLHSFVEVEDFLKGFVRNPRQKGGYTLDVIRSFLQYIDNPQERFNVIHVAGTSGKTSTCYYLASLLLQAGYKVGLTVSPHVDIVSERAQINLVPLVEKYYCQKFSDFLNILNQSGYQLSYFEIHVAFAYWLFAQEGVEYAVVEVGLGGLLDGTNTILRPDKICVITDIGFDHMEILGNTIEEIACQKSGIIMHGNTVFMHQQSKEIEAVVQDVCLEKEADLHIVTEPITKDLDGLPIFQKRNLALAVAATEFVQQRDGVSVQADIKRAATTYTPARMEVVTYEDKTIIIDGSHNTQKIHALVDSIKDKFPEILFSCLVSVGENKQNEIKGILQEVAAIAGSITFTSFYIGQDEFRKAIDPRILSVEGKKLGIKNINVVDNPALAFSKLLEKDNSHILVVGSFYLLNHIRPFVKQDV